MMNNIICRATVQGNAPYFTTELIEKGNVVGRIENNSTSLESIILSDKKYGVLKPKNGIYFTYKILSKDTELTNEQVNRGVKYALNKWHFPLKFDFKRAKSGERVDITFQFSSEADDPILNSSTLAYMYYPLGGINNGKCVINTRFFWTLDGNAVNMHLIDPVHYPDPKTAPIQGMSWDLDVVLCHEIGHGVFGLQHFTEGIMFFQYKQTAELPTDVDITRASFKIPKRNILASLLKRKMEWLTIASDRK